MSKKIEYQYAMRQRGQNAAHLVTVWALNAILFSWLFLDLKISLKNWESLLLIPLVVAFVSVLNRLINSNMKAILVYWTPLRPIASFRYPLPGMRAFSELYKRDTRIDPVGLSGHFGGNTPTDPKEQNRAWFMLYVSVKSNPSVLSCYRDYMFSRDYASMSLILLFLMIGLAFYYSKEPIRPICYSIAIVLQCVLVKRQAARHGEIFVTTVLAMALLNQSSPLAPIEDVDSQDSLEDSVDDDSPS